MTGYSLIHLATLIKEIGEEETRNFLSEFSCPVNPDVEHFLHVKAIEFAKQKLAQTHLVMTSYKQKPVLCGYFSLANKFLTIPKKSKWLSATLRKRINKFAKYYRESNSYCMAAPLIAQLGKNFTNGYNSLISGEELLGFALDKVQQMQMDFGGKVVYLECEDKQKLVEFYERYGFVVFAQRKLDSDETETLSGEYLVQMLKYIKNAPLG
jgi:hypothetical protein